MNARSIAFGVWLSMFSLPIDATIAIDSLQAAYHQTTMLMLEADLRLNLCSLKEFSLYRLEHPSENTVGIDSSAHLWPQNHTLTTAQKRNPA
jgi:hypothetical protein